MEYPPLVKGLTLEEDRGEFERIYCQGPIITFDGIAVRFKKRNFDHAFFESSSKYKRDDKFSPLRAERVKWIEIALQDPNAELYVGIDKKRKMRNLKRRVAIVKDDYVVVIAMKSNKSADFVTAFADTGPLPGRNFSSVEMIRMNPRWPRALKNR